MSNIPAELRYSEDHEWISTSAPWKIGVSDYAQNALIWATQNGILNGYGDGRVGPKANAERAQVAAMMARFIQNAQ